MKTKITKTAYTTAVGGKNQSCTCSVCNRHMRQFAQVSKIRGEKTGLYCSPQCIDREILSRRGVKFTDSAWIEIKAGRKI